MWNFIQKGFKLDTKLFSFVTKHVLKHGHHKGSLDICEKMLTPANVKCQRQLNSLMKEPMLTIPFY